MTKTTARYHITFADDTGSRHTHAYASSYDVPGDCSSRITSTVSNFDGEGHDLGVIEVTGSAEAHTQLEADLEADDNVVSYHTHDRTPAAPVLSDGTPAVVGLRVCGANWRTDLDCRDIGVIREISPNRVRIAWTDGESINDSPEHLVPAAQMELSGTLCDYETGDALGPATADEHSASREAAEHDGGAGVIRVDGRRCYVQE